LSNGLLSLWNQKVHDRVHNSPPSPRPCVTFRKKLVFYSDEFLAPRPISKVEDYPLSALRDCLFNILAATLHIWRRLTLRIQRPGNVWPSATSWCRYS